MLKFHIFRYKPTNLHNDYQDKIVFPTYQKYKETNNRSGLMNDGKKLLLKEDFGDIYRKSYF